jgi:hypothetical protein
MGAFLVARDGLLARRGRRPIVPIVQRVIKYHPKWKYLIQWKGWPKTARTWERPKYIPEKLRVRPSAGGPICTCDAFRGTHTCFHVCFLFLKYRGGKLPVNLRPIGTPNHFYGRSMDLSAIQLSLSLRCSRATVVSCGHQLVHIGVMVK